MDTNKSTEILKKAFKNEDELIINEVIKGTSLTFLGDTNVDLYIKTDKLYLERIVMDRLWQIQRVVVQEEGKTIRDVYLNKNKLEITIKELENKANIKTIDIEDFKKERTAEISGENDIVNRSTFEYDASIFNKKKAIIELHNKALNKQFLIEINPNILTSTFSYFKRKQLEKKIRGLLELRYEPVNNDTKEVIDILKINN